ncbi:predicted protein [Phaeodactylum tricornutum CCAP 1055/1]|jgi:hypothetical protein|uniref:Uncharacterized protein n=1 Tax=Phaeodactylum tricornutum (strain CCAP 1055/1) TaxID=556484 RepID=B7G1R3_PHATC|nr:predicted protein [Phaeodactylum tricornutum CCAP 1055/1]EEC47550.1 predicted protein [Phaeodactylum tricornutum CCAP 1055/1]|eukprot:XP_002180898.1 predicted protein [Phaeodactylum tricornutum CCAP 1055/1]
MKIFLLEYFANSNEARPVTLHITITVCSGGSSIGRICCSEFDIEWALLHMDWYLQLESAVSDPESPSTPKPLTNSATEQFADSSVIGMVDCCETNYCERAVLVIMAFKAAESLGKKVATALAAL